MPKTVQKPGLLRKLLRTAGPPLAIGFCVLSLSVLAAGTLAWFIMGDEIADTATALLGRVESPVPSNTVGPPGIATPADS